MAVRCPRAEALAATIGYLPASVNAVPKYEAGQRQLLGQVLGTDTGEKNFRVARHLPARR